MSEPTCGIWRGWHWLQRWGAVARASVIGGLYLLRGRDAKLHVDWVQRAVARMMAAPYNNCPCAWSDMTRYVDKHFAESESKDSRRPGGTLSDELHRS